MSRTDLILQELLDAIEGNSDFQDVLHRHSDSKSPLYSALARAIPMASHRLEKLLEKTDSARRDHEPLAHDLETLPKRISMLRDEVLETEEELRRLQGEATLKRGLLESVATLEEAGFTEQHLEQLQAVLTRFAADQSASTADTIELLFELVGRMESTVALGLEDKRMKATLKRAEASVARRKVQVRRLEETKVVLRAPLKSLDELLAQGVGACELIAWHRLIMSTGGSVGDLDKFVAEYGNVAAALSQLRKQRDSLQSQAQGISLEIDELEEKRDIAGSDVMRLRGEALALSLRRGRLEREGSLMGDHIQLARALLTTDPHELRQTKVSMVFYLVCWIIQWQQHMGVDPAVKPPLVTCEDTLIPRYASAPLSKLMPWLLRALLQMGVESQEVV